MTRLHPISSTGLPAKLQMLFNAGQSYLLIYRMPGTSMEFCLRSGILGLLRRGKFDYLCLAEGCELRLDWLVSVDGKPVPC
jgi:Rho-binding antiterminator